MSTNFYKSEITEKAKSDFALKLRGKIAFWRGSAKHRQPMVILCASMARLQLTLVLDSGARIGPGKVALLESVHSSGSISGAARAMGMDYKRAWLLIDSLNQAFKTPVVERTTGGAGGGGAALTPFGEELLARYRKLEAEARKLSTSDLGALERKSSGKAGPKV